MRKAVAGYDGPMNDSRGKIYAAYGLNAPSEKPVGKQKTAPR